MKPVSANDLGLRLAAFRQDMTEAGLHVGLAVGGDDPECTTCGELWPCPTEQGKRFARKWREMLDAAPEVDAPPNPGAGTTIVDGEQRIALAMLRPAMPPDEAIALAAWIVALADPLGQQFPADLAACLRT